MNTEIVLQNTAGEFRVDSRTMAEQLDNKHKSVMELIGKNADLFGKFGQLPFETEIAQGGKGGMPSRYALLNEDQCYFLLTLVRNSKKVTALKAALIMAFRQARDLAQARPAIPQTYAQALMAAAKAEMEREQLAATVQVLTPKAEAFDTFIDSEALLSIQSAGQLLNMGEKKFFAYLRDQGVLMTGGDTHNTPYRPYLEKGYFEVKRTVMTLNGGRLLQTNTTYVTPRGMEFLRRLLGRKPSNTPLPLLGASA